MNVYCYPVSRDSKYIPLLFEGIRDRYRPVYRQDGTLKAAIAEMDAGGIAIVHVHWEEFVLRACATRVEADIAVRCFAEDLTAFHRRGGAIVWTVHNALPHMIGLHAQFLAIRRIVAALSDRILVHNMASVDVLAGQVALDRSKLRVLPHPSYLGYYEDEAALQQGLGRAPDLRIQGFGWIRLQKGFGEMIGMLPAGFLQPRELRIRISGHGEETDAVIAQQAHRRDVEWDVRHVPDAEAAALLRSAACVILPYQRVLTSGVALLALSVGAMLVAVDIPQMRELLPSASQRFLYPRGDAAGLRRAIDEVLSLAPEERAAIIAANLAVARDLPLKIARRLAALYAAATAAR